MPGSSLDKTLRIGDSSNFCSHCSCHTPPFFSPLLSLLRPKSDNLTLTTHCDYKTKLEALAHVCEIDCLCGLVFVSHICLCGPVCAAGGREDTNGCFLGSSSDS